MLYEQVIRPFLFGISRNDPEIAHDLALASLRFVETITLLKWMLTQYTRVENLGLKREIFGLTFPNLIGLAAGFDKDGVAAQGLCALGFGHLELGTVTSVPQRGNRRPRIWRLPKDKALINAMGFNNQGAIQIAQNLKAAGKLPIPVGVNIGKSIGTPPDDMQEVVRDYSDSLRAVYPFADYICINVSSPNTPGLTKLQEKERLTILLEALQEEAIPFSSCGKRKPMLLKIAPDMSWNALDEVLQVCSDQQIDGIVATNTTTDRQGLHTIPQSEGGISGIPLKAKTLITVEHIHRQAPTLPIIGVGGVFHLEDVLQLLEGGASLVQVYTGLIYKGPFLARTLNKGLERRMHALALGPLSL